MKLIDKLAWIQIKDQAVLLTKSYGKDKFYIPGGKRELGETDEEALVREIQEELSVTIETDTLKFMGVFEAQAHGEPQGVLVRMTCYSGHYSGQLQPSSEIEALDWFTYADRDKLVGVDVLILDHLKTHSLLDQ